MAVVLVIAAAALVAAVIAAIALAEGGSQSSSQTSFASGKAAGLKATAKAIEDASPYGVYAGIAVVSLAPTYCARYDPTHLAGLKDNPDTVNVGTPWFLGCIAGIDAHATQLGDT